MTYHRIVKKSNPTVGYSTT